MIEVTPTTTLFYPLFEYGAKPEPDEMRAARRISTPGILQGLAVSVSGQSGEGNAIIRSRTNFRDGSMALSIPHGLTGTFEDTSNSDAVNSGDYVACSVTYPSSSSFTIDHVDALFIPHTLVNAQPTLPKIQRHEVAPLIRACEQAITPDEKGKAFEDLIEYVFGCIQGVQIVDRDVRTKTEEIDFVLDNTDESSPFPKAGPLILIECKYWNKPTGKDEFVLFQQKIRNRRGTCTVAFLISWIGFTATSYTEQLRGSDEHFVIVPLDRNDLEEMINTDAAQCLKAAWRKAVMT